MSGGSLPQEALERLTHHAHEHLRTRSAPRATAATVPVARSTWKQALADASIGPGTRDEFDAAIRAVTASTGTSDARALRKSSEVLARFSVSLADALTLIGALGPSPHGRVDELRSLVLATAAATLGDPATAPAGMQEEFQRNLARLLEVDEGFSADPFESAFGVSAGEVVDDQGVFSMPRLLAHYAHRYDDLEALVAQVLVPLTRQPLPLLSAIRSATALLTERPFLALKSATGVRALITDLASEDADAAAAPLRALKYRVDKSATNRAGITRVLIQIEKTDSVSDRNVMKLDVYRRMVEGQLRPWAWTLLRLRGADLPSMPEISSLRERLRSDGHWLLSDAADCLLSAARNASAHEDVEWDEQAQLLVVGDEPLDPDVIEDATERCYAFMAGAEAGWAVSRAESKDLASSLDRDDDTRRSRTLTNEGAIACFGTNGIHVSSYVRNLNTLSVTIGEPSPISINPCFQAVLQAFLYAEDIETVVVKVPGRERPIIEMYRPPAIVTVPIWLLAARTFGFMPESTFLAMNAWARLTVELPDEAGLAALRLGLNDALHAYNEHADSQDPAGAGLATLACRLTIVSSAIAATMSVLPPDAGSALAKGFEIVDEARRRASGGLPAILPTQARLQSDEVRIRTLYDGLPSVAVVPTLSRLPLHLEEARSQNQVPS